MTTYKTKTLLPGVLCSASIALLSASATKAHEACTSYIVEGQSAESVAKAVDKVGGHITHELPIINGVSALLTRSQVTVLRRQKQLTLFTDAPVTSQSQTQYMYNPYGYYAYTVGNAPIDPYARSMAGVEDAAAAGFDGTGVTIAVLDSGVWNQDFNVNSNSNRRNRLLAVYDAIVG